MRCQKLPRYRGRRPRQIIFEPVTYQSCKQDHVVRSQSICLSGMCAAWASEDNPLMVPALYEDPASFSREKMSN
jgi:hypothetical protein